MDTRWINTKFRPGQMGAAPFIPVEVLLCIFKFCPPKDLVNCQLVCQSWNTSILSNDTLLWKHWCANQMNSGTLWRCVYKEFAVLTLKLGSLFEGRSRPKVTRLSMQIAPSAKTLSMESAYLAIVSQHTSTFREHGDLVSSLLAQPMIHGSASSMGCFQVKGEWDQSSWSCASVYKGEQKLYSERISLAPHIGYLMDNEAYVTTTLAGRHLDSTAVSLYHLGISGMLIDWTVKLPSAIHIVRFSKSLLVCLSHRALYVLKRSTGQLLSVIRDQSSYALSDVIITPKNHILAHTKGHLFVYNSSGQRLASHRFSPHEWTLTPTQMYGNSTHFILRMHQSFETERRHRLLFLDVDEYKLYELSYRIEELPRGKGYFLMKSSPMGRSVDYVPVY